MVAVDHVKNLADKEANAQKEAEDRDQAVKQANDEISSHSDAVEESKERLAALDKAK